MTRALAIIPIISIAAILFGIAITTPAKALQCNWLQKIFGCSDEDVFIIPQINSTSSGGNTTVIVTFFDASNIFYKNQSNIVNNYTQFSNFTKMTDLNLSGIVYVGENRSAFPVTCSGNNLLSSLGATGIFICSSPIIYNASYEGAYNKTYEGAYNVSYESTYNISYESTYNVTYEKAYNVSYELMYNVSYELMYNKTYELMYNQSYEINWANVAFLNNTQNFTAQNTFQDFVSKGYLNVTNQTVFTVLNNVSSKGYINASGFNATSNSIFGNGNFSGYVNSTSFLVGTMCNASTFNATSNSIFGNVNASGYVNSTSFIMGTTGNFSFENVSNTAISYYDNSTYQNATKNVTGSSIGVMQINQSVAGYYPAVVLLFENETEVSGTTVQWLNFTLPAANGFSRIIVTTEYTILGTSATAYSWVLEIAVGGTIIHDTNITASAITSDIFRSSAVMQAGTTTTTGKLTVKLYPITAGSATVELQDLIVYGVV